jgi:hypothetical protein
MFPGTHVAVERLQKSGRILSARTSGPALRLPERSHDMPYWLVAQEEECPRAGLGDAAGVLEGSGAVLIRPYSWTNASANHRGRRGRAGRGGPGWGDRFTSLMVTEERHE